MKDGDLEELESRKALYRRGKQAASHSHPRRWPVESPAAQARSIVLFVALCSAAFLLTAPSSGPGPSKPTAEQEVETPRLEAREGEGRAAAWAVGPWLAAWLFGSLGVGCFLAAQARLAGARPTRGLRAVAGIAGGFPTFGLLFLPIWAKWVREEPPPWLRFAWRVPRGGRAASGSPFRPSLGSRWLLRKKYLGSFLLAGVMANGLLLVSLHEPASGAFAEVARALLPWALRGLGFALMGWYFRYELRRHGLPGWRRGLFLLLWALWWIPGPLGPMLALASYLHTDSSRREESLTRTALAGRGSAPEWQRLEAKLERASGPFGWMERLLGRLPSRRRRPALADAELGLRALCWLRASALLPEAGLLGAFLAVPPAWADARMPWELFLEIAQKAALLVGSLAAIAMVGLFLRSALGFRREKQKTWNRVPILPYLAFTQLFFWGGLAAGEAFALGDLAEAGAVFAILGLGGALAQILPVLLSVLLPVPQPPATEEVRRLLAVLAFGGLWAGGLLLLQGLPWELDFAGLALALTLFSVLGAARLVSYLFLPFSPSGLRDPRVTGPERGAWLALLVSGISPLGGLAVPAWLLLRAKLWPGLRRRLLSGPEPGTSSPADEPLAAATPPFR